MILFSIFAGNKSGIRFTDMDDTIAVHGDAIAQLPRF